MADLKAAVSTLGLDDVQTYLQSGNMVFRATPEENAQLAGRISQAIREHAGMDVAVMVRTSAEWENVVSGNPFPQAMTAPKTLHAFIFDGTPDPSRLDMLAAKETGREEWRLAESALYLHTPDGFGKSVLGGVIERVLKVPMTARNWNTVLALREMSREA
jgi:uncharacterized protein (DUF1697 family)